MQHLAAAEISIKMSELQVEAVLMGLLISGGMMIPGNIPNIISAGKLKIKSSEWIKLGVPLGTHYYGRLLCNFICNINIFCMNINKWGLSKSRY